MEILKTAIDWAKAELFSTPFFILFGLVFLLASLGFWQLGKTEIARAYIIPTLIAGVLLLTIGIGLFYTNKTRIKEFEIAYNKDASTFIESELQRAESTLKEYKTIVFKAIPLIIATCAIAIIFLDKPIWRASLITTIAMLTVILLVDETAHSRIKNYKNQLEIVKE
ncbi:hypothetical protein HNV10_03830 [Winogradskyella litoriviva]|uniref:Uncharacterized protein n=1 Tax=Winogradskyella litoriviva TaxID=1220182 RepID=A0ABX2E300_9FLAO|nr:hypothetical protein [Winogradskyella litoriviva]NRD22356.1 hypothetical protein [Winogradskyella litoriviva]